MDHFNYRDGSLHAEAIPLASIAAAVDTPCYVYSTATLERHYRVVSDAFSGLDPLICYAVKANGSLAIIHTLARRGAGADVVSGGELRAAIAGGVSPGRIVFSGVGKSRDELAEALQAGILRVNVESFSELELLSAVAVAQGTKTAIAIRVNPDVDAGTHAKITTARSDSKFGIHWTLVPAAFDRAAALPGLQPVGLAMHIGSQLTDLAPFAAAFRRMGDLARGLENRGFRIDSLDVGGGLGIPYGNEAVALPQPADHARIVRETLGGLVGAGRRRLILEPGRVLVGNAGVLLTRVLHVKPEGARPFVIVDAAMNDLARPALYGAYHSIVPVVAPPPGASSDTVDVVGPVCESGDTFARARSLPPVAAGDLLAIRTAGAYGATMASMYNLRPLIPEVMVRGERFMVVRERICVDDLIARQRIPLWFDEEPAGAAHPAPETAGANG